MDSFYSARAMAMGGAFTAVPGDPVSIFYNPAFLGTVRRFSVQANALSEDHLPSGESDQGVLNGVVAVPFKSPSRQGTLGIAGLYGRRYDQGAERLEDFGYGTRGLFEGDAGRFDLGAELGVIGNNFEGAPRVVEEGSLSAGALYRKSDFYAGFSLLNLTAPGWRAGPLSASDPMTASLGVARAVRDYTIAADASLRGANAGNPASQTVGAGFERWWWDARGDSAALRAGLRLADRGSTWDWGLGFRIFGARIDYAMSVPLEGPWQFGNALSVALNFGGGGPESNYEKLLRQDLRYRQDLTRALNAEEAKAWRLERELKAARASIKSQEAARARTEATLQDERGERAKDLERLDKTRESVRSLKLRLEAQAHKARGPGKQALFDADMASYKGLKLRGVPRPLLIDDLRQILEEYKDSGVDLSSAQSELMTLLRE